MATTFGFGTDHVVVVLANALGWKLSNCPRDFLFVSYEDNQVKFEDPDTKIMGGFFFGFGTLAALAHADKVLSRKLRAFVPTDSCFHVWDIPGFSSAEEAKLKVSLGQHESWTKVVSFE